MEYVGEMAEIVGMTGPRSKKWELGRYVLVVRRHL